MLYICPSRGRPDNVARLLRGWEDTRTFAHLLIALDEDDPELLGYSELLMNYVDKNGTEPYWLHWEVRPRMRLGGTLNYWAVSPEAAPYSILGFLGDDHLPATPAWDSHVEAAVDSMGGIGVVYGNDLLQGANLPTAVAISSNIIHTLGYYVPIGQTHLYLDDYWKFLGQQIGRLRYLPDVVIEHLHPVAGKAEWDDRYREVNAGEVYEEDFHTFEAWKRDQAPTAIAQLLEMMR